MAYRNLLKLLLLVPVLFLQACFPPIIMPRIEHEEEYSGYVSLSPPASPWLSLSNGLDLYGWHDCYAFVLRGEACNSLNLAAVPTGQQPDWKELWRGLASTGAVQVQGHFERPVSAYRDTSYRLLGMSSTLISRNDDVWLIRPPKADVNQATGPTIWRFDVWHNGMMPCRDRTLAIPKARLVVFEDRRLWIFAESEHPCDVTPDADFIPRELLKFDGVEPAHAALLAKPMQLFFFDLDFASEADFHLPRQVTRDAGLAARQRRTRIAFERVPLPQEAFHIDGATFQRDVVNPLQPTQLCRYSRTEMFFSGMSSARKVPTLQECQPYSDATMQLIRSKRDRYR